MKKWEKKAWNPAIKLRDRIENLEDIGKLKILIKIAAKTDSIADFAKEAEPYLMSED